MFLMFATDLTFKLPPISPKWKPNKTVEEIQDEAKHCTFFFFLKWPLLVFPIASYLDQIEGI